jgi:hypothetical protein
MHIIYTENKKHDEFGEEEVFEGEDEPSLLSF